jgi:hypothetical protein
LALGYRGGAGWSHHHAQRRMPSAAFIVRAIVGADRRAVNPPLRLSGDGGRIGILAAMPLPKQSEDFPAWYQEVVKQAELAESSLARGTMVIKPSRRGCWSRRRSTSRASRRRWRW